MVLPKSLTFTGGSGAGFESSPQDPSMQTFMTRNAIPGKAIEFSISGTGSFPREDQTAQGNAGDNGGQQAGGPGNQPGGGQVPRCFRPGNQADAECARFPW